MKTHRITFQPDNVQVNVEHGKTILDAANQAGIAINAFCGGAGSCHKCLVKIAGHDELLLACQYHITSDLVVEVPETSRLTEQKILNEGLKHSTKPNPTIRKYYLPLSEPTINDLASDTERVCRGIIEHTTKADITNRHMVNAGKLEHTKDDENDFAIPLPLLRELPDLLRGADYKITAVCQFGQASTNLIAIEQGDTTDTVYGLAIDIGTTTVVVQLVDMLTGKIIAVASRGNPQVPYGDDVISRIEFSSRNGDNSGIMKLHKAIIDGINELTATVCKQADVNPQSIYEATIAGNTVMLHLFLGVSARHIAQSPYVAAFSSAQKVPACQLSININPNGNIYVMPGIAAHVGSDTVAVALACEMQQSEKINLAIDIGTNGEIVLGNRNRLLACSTAAGPALEGARITKGMRAGKGAIEHVHIKPDGRLQTEVIGNTQAIGICGSGLVDALAELLNWGIIDKTGRLLAPQKLPANIPTDLSCRIIMYDNAPAFVLDSPLPEKGTEIKSQVILTQRDIREAQLAKAAIRAGVETLLHELNITTNDIDNLYLAGAFGNYISPAGALRIGLIPQLAVEKIIPVGNAAGTGAHMVLINHQARRRAEKLASGINYVELAGRTDFQDTFAEYMLFS